MICTGSTSVFVFLCCQRRVTGDIARMYGGRVSDGKSCRQGDG